MRNIYGRILDEVADNLNGLMVETGTMLHTTYMIQTQQEIFNVYGRIRVINLFGEVVVACSATATTLKFNATWATPVIAVADMSAASGSISAKVAGTRIVLIGGAVATAALVDAGPGITASTIPMVIGLKSGIGTIGILTATANQTSGSSKFVICYVPLSDGAYVTAAH